MPVPAFCLTAPPIVAGIKLKKIEEKWINNDFKVSDKEVVQVLEN